MEEKLKFAKVRLMDKYPYLSDAIIALKMIKASPKDPFYWMACDKKWRVYYKEKFVQEGPQEEIDAVLHHEMDHLLFDHFLRQTWYDGNHRDWRDGTEYEINTRIRKAGEKLPDGVMYPEQNDLPQNLTAEEYARLLEKLPKEEKPQKGQGQGQGQGQNQDQDSGEGDSDDEENHGNCGSGAGHGKGSWELPNDDVNEPGLEDYEIDEIKKRVAKAIKEAQKTRGDIPGEYIQFAEKVIASEKVPWHQYLKNGIFGALSRIAGSGGRTYTRPHRRSAQIRPVILPGKVQRKPIIAAIGDSSGSVSDEDLEIFMGIIERALLQVGGEAWVLMGDMDSNPVKVRTLNGIEFKGRGGTDMGHLIGIADSLSPHPEVIICITDGETPWGVKPKAELITVISTDASGPDWGKVIRIDPK